MKKRWKKAVASLVIFCILAAAAYAAMGVLYPARYIPLIRRYSLEFSLKPELVCAVINTESRFDSRAKSSKGASGLMQLVESTAVWGANELGISGFQYSQICDPELNIRIGCWYIRKLIDQFGSVDTAMAAYNAGSGNVAKWLRNLQYSFDGENLASIPFPETAAYVKRVGKNVKIYRLILKLI